MDSSDIKTEDFIIVKIIAPDKLLFEGQVTAISSKNSKGDFDIIPDHTNFITVITEQLIIINLKGEERQFTFSTGIVHFYNGIADIYLNIDL